MLLTDLVCGLGVEEKHETNSISGGKQRFLEGSNQKNQKKIIIHSYANDVRTKN